MKPTEIASSGSSMQWKSWFSSPWFLSVWCTVSSFGTYGCMYALRKPFTAGSYSSISFEGHLKTWLVLAQVVGYTLAKLIGIRVISEIPSNRRSQILLGLIGMAVVSLLFFAIAPPLVKPFCLFINGLSLGMVYGLVLGFLEGRRLTEAFVAGLCASFILADGFTKSVGADLLKRGILETWMPLIAGLLFLMPMVGFIWMLRQIPAPSSDDVIARSARTPMNWPDRRQFVLRHGPGLAGLLLMYVLVTVLRSLRADFAPELWAGLGARPDPSAFTRSEIWVALGVLLLHAALVGIPNNWRAFVAGLIISFVGLAILIAALTLRQHQDITAFPFMVLMGVGLYLPYVAAHTTLFERLLAMTRDRGNIGFIMYLADAVGYLGYVGVMLVRQFVPVSTSFISWFIWVSWIVIVGSAVGLGFALAFYKQQLSRWHRAN